MTIRVPRPGQAGHRDVGISHADSQLLTNSALVGDALLPLGVAVPAAAAAGWLLDTAYPSVGWWPLAWVSVIVVLVCLVGRNLGGALLVGVVYGAVFNLTHLRWVAEFLGPVPWLALVAVQASLIAAGSALITLLDRWSWSVLPGRRSQIWLVPILVAGTWTLREMVMGAWPYGGFPWARLVSQVDSPFAQTLSWVGANGLSFLMVVVCATIVQAVRVTAKTFSPFIAGTSSTRTDAEALLLAVALTLLLLAVPSFPTRPTGELRVGWVQGNGPTGYFDDRPSGAVLARQTTATKTILGQDMDLLVWPEGGVDSDPLTLPATASTLNDLGQQTAAPLLVNAPTVRNGQSFNTSLLWTRTGPSQLYDKVNPVPFGEYIPDRWLYERIVPDLIGLLQRDYTPGSRPPVVVVNGTALGLAICFDVIYDSVTWDGARRGAQAYIFQTNNADFRGTDENMQQLAFARLRAIEAGRSAVNVSTVGTSQVIGPDGSVTDQAGADQTVARVTTVSLRTGTTPAVLIGPAVAKIIGWGTVSAVAALLLASRGRIRSSRSSSGERR